MDNQDKKEIIVCKNMTEYNNLVNEIFKKHRENLRTFSEQKDYLVMEKK